MHVAIGGQPIVADLQQQQRLPANQAQALMCYEKAAQMGHAKSMNLYGRYLEQGIATAPSPARAVQSAQVKF